MSSIDFAQLDLPASTASREAHGRASRLSLAESQQPRPVEPPLDRTVFARDVFESLPYGAVVVDERGRVLAFNGLLHDFLAFDAVNPPSTCCEMFGCRRPGTTLERGCLTEFAQEANGRLSETLVELPSGSSPNAVRVTVSPLGGVSHYMFHVRSGERRVENPLPRIHPGDHLRVHTLGRFHVEAPTGSLAGPWLEQRPGELLKLLCTERRREVFVDEIAEALWPNRGFQARGFVRHFVHVLRNRLEPDRARGESSFILAPRGGYALDRRLVRIDADEFERGLKAGELALANGDRSGAVDRLEDALKLYHGDFLSDERYAEWALAERNRLRSRAEDALRAISDIKRECRDLEGASAALERLAVLQPFDSDVQRDLIGLQIRRGRRTEAMRRYGELRKRLHREFGEEPDFQLADLAG